MLSRWTWPGANWEGPATQARVKAPQHCIWCMWLYMVYMAYTDPKAGPTALLWCICTSTYIFYIYTIYKHILLGTWIWCICAGDMLTPRKSIKFFNGEETLLAGYFDSWVFDFDRRVLNSVRGCSFVCVCGQTCPRIRRESRGGGVGTQQEISIGEFGRLEILT